MNVCFPKYINAYSYKPNVWPLRPSLFTKALLIVFSGGFLMYPIPLATLVKKRFEVSISLLVRSMSPICLIVFQESEDLGPLTTL